MRLANANAAKEWVTHYKYSKPFQTIIQWTAKHCQSMTNIRSFTVWHWKRVWTVRIIAKTIKIFTFFCAFQTHKRGIECVWNHQRQAIECSECLAAIMNDRALLIYDNRSNNANTSVTHKCEIWSNHNWSQNWNFIC